MEQNTPQPLIDQSLEKNSMVNDSSKRNNNMWRIISIISISCILLFGIFALIVNIKAVKQRQITVSIPTVTPPVTNYISTIVTNARSIASITPFPTSPNGGSLKTYTNSTYHYSLSYPSTWTLDAIHANPNPMAYNGTEVTITSPEGNVLTLEYDNSTGGVPLHIEKSLPVIIAGQAFLKTYNDGCDFNVSTYFNNMENPGYYDCTNRSYTDRGIFQITYGLGKDISHNIIPEYTTLHGKNAALRFNFKTHVPLGAENSKTFQQTDAILDKIVASITFTP